MKEELLELVGCPEVVIKTEPQQELQHEQDPTVMMTSTPIPRSSIDHSDDPLQVVPLAKVHGAFVQSPAVIKQEVNDGEAAEATVPTVIGNTLLNPQPVTDNTLLNTVIKKEIEPESETVMDIKQEAGVLDKVGGSRVTSVQVIPAPTRLIILQDTSGTIAKPVFLLRKDAMVRGFFF